MIIHYFHYLLALRSKRLHQFKKMRCVLLIQSPPASHQAARFLMDYFSSNLDSQFRRIFRSFSLVGRWGDWVVAARPTRKLTPIEREMMVKAKLTSPPVKPAKPARLQNPSSSNLVLGTGLEPARLAATASKTVVYAIPPPERSGDFRF